ncbi:MAG: Crp/Fnr family transcriptional regulator [Spirochaetia bacterium]|nr:Crp/Fnr family transcriptional regulator [Spirochaetia bacterium]MBQ6673937.1 Crp/Fnr family transcriptional regulator [Spirochaetia bacterium]
MKKNELFLKECNLFSNIDSTHLQAMLVCLGAREKTFRKGSVIFACGEKAETLGIVLSGKVQMIRIDYYGNRSIVAEMGNAQIFGEVFACSDIDTLPVDFLASEESSVLLINARRITKTCSHACAFHRQIIFNLLKLVATKSLLFGQKIDIVSRRTTREKLLAYLGTVARQTGKKSFTIPYSRQELADYLDVERSGLSAEIGKMCRENIIKCHRSEFTLLHNTPYNGGA